MRHLPPLHSFAGRAARRAITENPDINHDAQIGCELDPADARRSATRATRDTLILSEAYEHNHPLAAEKVRTAIARPAFAPTDGYEAAIAAAFARAAEEEE